MSLFFAVYLTQRNSHTVNLDELDYNIYTITRVSTAYNGVQTSTKTIIHRPVSIKENTLVATPTPRSLTSNTNDDSTFIIESQSKEVNKGLLQWKVTELTDPVLISNYYKPGTSNFGDSEQASATFTFKISRIIEYNDTIGIEESKSIFNIKSSETDVNYTFETNIDSRTEIDVFKFSQMFLDSSNHTNVILNYMFASESVNVNSPKYAILNPRTARCFLEIRNWNYQYENSKLLITTSIVSSDLVWSVKKENVINLNNSEGKIQLIDGVETSSTNNIRNATLSLYEDVVEFEEDEIETNFMITDIQKSNYLLADIEILLRSNVLDIMAKEYAENLNMPSSGISFYSSLFKWKILSSLIIPCLILILIYT